jgi:YfiH family protein
MIKPEWPVPAHIVAGVTWRTAGVSEGVYASNNLAMHVGDNPLHVEQNRKALDAQLPGQKQWQWLEQVHGVAVVDAPTCAVEVADASFTNKANVVCTVLTADCLPVLLCDVTGKEVAAIHAGWRSLCGGVIENALDKFSAEPSTILAWLGPAIGAQQFEVGEDVVTAFQQAPCGQLSKAAFVARGNGKYLADIYQLARIRLHSKGVSAIYGGGLCTVSDAENFYSFRRDNATGRMASFIYIQQ